MLVSNIKEVTTNIRYILWNCVIKRHTNITEIANVMCFKWKLIRWIFQPYPQSSRNPEAQAIKFDQMSILSAIGHKANTSEIEILNFWLSFLFWSQVSSPTCTQRSEPTPIPISTYLLNVLGKSIWHFRRWGTCHYQTTYHLR